MGVNRLVILDPNVRKVYVELAEPTLEDQRSDIERLRDAMTAEGHDMKADLSALRSLPMLLREAEFRITAVLGGDQLIAIEPGDTRDQSYGVAFDLGTTTVVGTLMNLRTGMAEAVRSNLNGQAPFGADVISRISHGMQGAAEREELRTAILKTMNQLLADLYEAAGVPRDRVYESVIVGNATMLHLLLGIDATPDLDDAVCARLSRAALPACPRGRARDSCRRIRADASRHRRLCGRRHRGRRGCHRPRAGRQAARLRRRRHQRGDRAGVGEAGALHGGPGRPGLRGEPDPMRHAGHRRSHRGRHPRGHGRTPGHRRGYRAERHLRLRPGRCRRPATRRWLARPFRPDAQPGGGSRASTLGSPHLRSTGCGPSCWPRAST